MNSSGHRREQQRNLTEADHFAKLLLGDKQAGTHPSLDLIAALPALHIAANCFDDRESGSMTLVRDKVRRS
jgi:hypothetical protein